MRPALLLVTVISGVTLAPPLLAQTSALELQAGLGYARAFDGGGISFAAAVERPLSRQTSRVQQALGGSFWYSQMSIGSQPSSSNERQLMGIGMRYQLELRAGRTRPFLAVPLQVLRSNIPVQPTLQPASLSVTGVPDPGPTTPIEDRMGSEWGWGAGLELGFRVGLSQQLSAQTSVQGLYHRIYESGGRNGAWTIHAGLTYQLGSNAP
jgi:hypothetical protein